MDWIPGVVATYGGLVILIVAFLENIGVPFPAFPILLLAGALSRAGRISVVWAIGAAAIGALAADTAWFQLGRWRGRGVLNILCKISLNPDACVQGAEEAFHRHRAFTILTAKFIPGVNTVMPPLAGISSMSLPLFLLIDTGGAFSWAFCWIGLGWFFGAQIARQLGAAQAMLGWFVLGGAVAYLAYKVAYRFYLVSHYSVPRMPPRELHEKISAGRDVLVLDLRSDSAFNASPAMVRGAVRIRPAIFHRTVPELRPKGELIIYCS